MPKRFYEIFRAGNYPQGNFDAEDIRQIAENYDPSFLEAPITIDHRWGGPAYGWIEELKAEGERLLATFKDVSDHLKCMTATRQYKRHSVEIYNDVDDRGPYLKALSMLGANAPQIKGMPSIEFSSFSEQFPEDESTVAEFEDPVNPGDLSFSEFFAAWLGVLDMNVQDFSDKTDIPPSTIASLQTGLFDEQLDDDLVEQFESIFESIRDDDVSDDMLAGLRDALANAEVIDQTEEPEFDAQAFAQMQQRVQTLEDKLQQERDEKEDFKSKAEQMRFDQRKSDFTSFLDDQVEDGKLLPKLKDKAVSLFAHLDGLQANEKEEQSPLEIFKNIIDGLPEIDLEEQAKKEDQPKDFSTAQELAEEASKYMQEQREKGTIIGSAAAVNHVKKQRSNK